MSRQHPDADRSLVALLADPALRVERAHDLGPEGDESESIVSWQARAIQADPLLLARLTTPSETPPAAEKEQDRAAARHRESVLRSWAVQPIPLLVAPNVQLARHWLATVRDLTSQGRVDVVTYEHPERLRGRTGLVVIVRAYRLSLTTRQQGGWDQIRHLLDAGHFSTWTEDLP